MAKSVPDFAKLHAKFNTKMENSRKDFKGTVPTEFALNVGKKSAAQGRTWMNAQNDPESRWKGLGTWTDDRLEAEKDKERMKKTGSFSRHRPNTTAEAPKIGQTKSSRLLKDSSNKWKEQWQEKERQSYLEEEQRKETYNKNKGRIQGHSAIVDNKSKLDQDKENRIKQGKQALKDTEKNYKNQLKEM